MSIELKRLRRAALLGSAACVAASMAATSVSAQDAAAEELGDFEEVVVTGSRIKNANISSPSPVTSLGAESIEMRGNTQIEDMLTILPQSVAANGDGNFAGTGVANVNLRGLGANRTLVLMDGRRLPMGQSDNIAVNLHQIPSRLIQRVDVLTGGASAVYGADAVAGVVNFVMKRDFEGISIDGQMSINQADNDSDRFAAILEAGGQPVPGSKLDGFTWSTDILIGANTDDGRGNVTASFAYREANEILQRNRDYAACAFGNGDPEYSCVGSSTTFPARILSALGNFSIIAFDRDTGETRDYYSGGPGDPFNDTFNFAITQRTRAPSERFAATVFSHYDLTDNIELFMDLAYTNQNSQGQIGPSGSFGHASGLNCDNPFFSAEMLDIICTQQGYSGDDINPNALVRRRNADGGPRQYRYDNHTFRVSGGARGDLSDAWSYELYGQFARVSNTRYNENVLNNARVDRALLIVTDPATGNPVCKSTLDGSDPNCLPWNIFSPDGLDPTSAISYITPPTLEGGEVIQKQVEATFTGDLGQHGFTTPWADTGVQFVGGFSRRIDSLDYDVDATLFDNGTLPIDESINVTEFFGELAIPLIEGAEMAEELTATAAFRWSDYSTTGTSNTWALGLTWQPVSDIRIRGQIQQAVRAPNIFELFLNQYDSLFDLAQDNNGIYDPCAGANPRFTFQQCANQGVTAAQYGNVLDNPAGQFNSISGGNPDLNVETSKTYTLGAILTPSAIEGLTLSVDWYSITVDDFVGVIPASLSINNCANDNDPFYCNLITRDQGGGLWLNHDTSNVITTNINTGSLKAEGIDINASYSFDLPDGWGSMSINYIGNYLITREEETLPGLEPFECAGFYDTDGCDVPHPKYGHTATASWNMENGANVSLTWRYIDGTELRGGNPTNQNFTLKTVQYLDLATSFEVYEGVRVRAGINNILGTRPAVTSATPAGLGTGNSFPGLYDVDMRYAFVGFTADF